MVAFERRLLRPQLPLVPFSNAPLPFFRSLRSAQPLDQLRQRLLIDSQRGRSIYMATVAEKMDPMCKSLVTALEGIQRPSDDKEKDGLGITAEQKTADFMGACMTLVDFVKGNKAAEQIEDGTETATRDVEKEVRSEDDETLRTFYGT